MMHFLAQTGGGGGGGWGNWLSPRMLQAAFWIAFVLISVLGTIIKKANEQRLKRQAEQARMRREEEALRTGRPVMDAPPPSPLQARDFEPVAGSPATSQSAKQATAEDARRKLQELAERRRRELAEVMRRAQQGGSAPSAPAAPAPSRGMAAPPPPRPPSSLAPPSAPPARQRPQQQKQQPKQRSTQRGAASSQPQDLDARRRREAQANREAEIRATTQERADDAEAARLDSIARVARGVGSTPTESAYDLPGTRRAESASAAMSGASIGAAMARVGAGAKTASAVEWRKAIVLSELLHRPVGMREDGERVL